MSNPKEWQHRQREQGLCIDCLAEALPGQSRCETHRDKHRAADKRYREARPGTSTERWRRHRARKRNCAEVYAEVNGVYVREDCG